MSAGRTSRAKGLGGERECADLWSAGGWTVRGLEGQGDWLAMNARARSPIGPPVIHLEIKRQERLRLPEWLAQADTETPPGVPAVVCFRQNRAEWYAALKLSALLELIS